MPHHEIKNQIIEHLEACTDFDLLDLVLKLFLESGY